MVAHDGNQAAGHALAGAVHSSVPVANVYVFASRFTGDNWMAIFERAFGRLRAIRIAELVWYAEFLEALDDYDIVQTGPPSRAN